MSWIKVTITSRDNPTMTAQELDSFQRQLNTINSFPVEKADVMPPDRRGLESPGAGPMQSWEWGE